MERVEKARDKLRVAGPRPVQAWIPDTRRPGFAAEVSRECRLIAAAEETREGRGGRLGIKGAVRLPREIATPVLRTSSR